MGGDDPMGELERAGRQALADELYDQRCALAELGWDEKNYTPERSEMMHRRVAALEPLVGDYLDKLLADED